MQWQTLSPKARWLFHLQALLRWAVFWIPVCAVGTGVLATAWSLVGALAVFGGWLLLQLVLALWMPTLSWERWAWALREQDLVITHGVIFRSMAAIPYARVQHVDVRQGPVERSFGLARVSIYTASGMGADGVIPGLELSVAESLRDRLVRVEGDGGV